jgi:hypothetical protein
VPAVPTTRVQTYLVAGTIVALVVGWFGVAYLRADSAQPGGDPEQVGLGNAATPSQVVAPVGQAVGGPVPSPAPFKADFTVDVPPPPTISPLDPGYDDLATADKIVDVFPGEVETWVGAEATGLDEMGGAAIDGRTAFVATADSLLAVDLKSGDVTTLAGSPGQAGCLPSSEAADVRLQGPGGDVALAGHNLFVSTGCGIAKIDTLSGATSFLEPWSGPLTIGPDGHLYVGASMDGQPVIVRVDPADGTTTRYLALPPGSAVMGLAADAEYLWAVVDEGPSSPSVVDTVRFADGIVMRYAVQGFDVAGAGQLASAGPYLYAPSVGNLGVLRFTKRLGAWGLAAGGNEGNEDGIWNWAGFGAVRGLASDGSDQIWVTDSINHSLRAVAFSQRAGLMLGGA